LLCNRRLLGQCSTRKCGDSKSRQLGGGWGTYPPYSLRYGMHRSQSMWRGTTSSSNAFN